MVPNHARYHLRYTPKIYDPEKRSYTSIIKVAVFVKDLTENSPDKLINIFSIGAFLNDIFDFAHIGNNIFASGKIGFCRS